MGYPTAEEELKLHTERFLDQVEMTEKVIAERDALRSALAAIQGLSVGSCLTCRFWMLDEQDCYEGLISPRDPVDYSQIDPTEEGGEEKVAAKWGHAVRRCKSPKVTFYQRPEKDGATVIDGSEYMAQLLTGPDFGCVHHCSKNTDT